MRTYSFYLFCCLFGFVVSISDGYAQTEPPKPSKQKTDTFPSLDELMEQLGQEDRNMLDSTAKHLREAYLQFLENEQNWRKILTTKEEFPAVNQNYRPYLLPLDKGIYRISSKFGMRLHPILKRRVGHKGIDLARIGAASIKGKPVYATAKGKVVRASWAGGYGNFVLLSHGSKYRTAYGHLLRYTVYAGQNVEAGQIIGYVGSTGNSTGPHLHYEVLENLVPKDPLLFMLKKY